MGILDVAHAAMIYGRRVECLAHHLSEVIPSHATVLDVGCGDGLIDRALLARRPDLTVDGMDVLVRPHTMIPARGFDGTRIPLADRDVDVVTFIDVLHHTRDPLVLLREASRVARRAIVIKDHLADGPLSNSLLRLMDWIGNERHGVVLPYNYWSSERWFRAFDDLGLTVREDRRDLHLYPPGLNMIFGTGLHFIVGLELTETPIGSASRPAREPGLPP